jgi:hypothetical protein
MRALGLRELIDVSARPSGCVPNPCPASNPFFEPVLACPVAKKNPHYRRVTSLSEDITSFVGAFSDTPS